MHTAKNPYRNLLGDEGLEICLSVKLFRYHYILTFQWLIRCVSCVVEAINSDKQVQEEGQMERK